ncbi:adenosine kinase [Marinivivus vitaminiproducens]|uniref:adenosine kinase n=1 Tax=Marinivivus vitaminiproducens TaxID=3035935 RepID=UPI0027A4ACAD|nr:adenosine kinase [Geminicoccaceae bacterium SCSIO 64248]
MPQAAYDVLGIGNAIVDVIGQVSDDLLAKTGLAKGSMTLIDAGQAESLYAEMAQTVEVSGGSCANTMATMASLGGRSAYIGRVHDDATGTIFGHDMRGVGVTFRSTPSREGLPTARCLIFVTSDAQRTMATYLGACVELSPSDIDEDLVTQAGITYLEGYLWDKPDAKAACLKAADLAHKAGNRVALTLSDSFCVERWRSEFLDLIDEHVDILVANEGEITALFPGASFDEAVKQVADRVAIAALTRGPAGCVVVDEDGATAVAQDRIENVVDTTGAGDAFAAGFLYGVSHDLGLPASARLGNLAAGKVITQYGARALGSLTELVAAAKA